MTSRRRGVPPPPPPGATRLLTAETKEVIKAQLSTMGHFSLLFLIVKFPSCVIFRRFTTGKKKEFNSARVTHILSCILLFLSFFLSKKHQIKHPKETHDTQIQNGGADKLRHRIYSQFFHRIISSPTRNNSTISQIVKSGNVN